MFDIRDSKFDIPSLLRRYRSGDEPDAVFRHGRGRTAATVFELSFGDSRYILKLYPDPAQARPLEVVARTLKRTRKAGLPVPEVVGQGAEPVVHLLYRKIEGIPADEHAGDPYGVWREVGVQIARLHRLDAPGYGRPRSIAEEALPWYSSWTSYVEAMTERLTGPDAAERLDAAAPRLRLRIRRRLTRLRRWRFAPAVIHSNLTGGNIMVDPGSGALRGIIDWDALLFGRAPQWELATALLWADEPVRAGFLDGYGLTGEELERMRPDVEAARLVELTRYLHWHLATGDAEMAGAVRRQIEEIVG